MRPYLLESGHSKERLLAAWNGASPAPAGLKRDWIHEAQTRMRAAAAAMQKEDRAAKFAHENKQLRSIRQAEAFLQQYPDNPEVIRRREPARIELHRLEVAAICSEHRDRSSKWIAEGDRCSRDFFQAARLPTRATRINRLTQGI